MPLEDSSLEPSALGRGKGRFSLPDDFDAVHAEEIRKMFEQGI